MHLTGAGSCTVKADQAGDANYNPAPQVSRTFSIAKATPIVTATGGTFTPTASAKTGSGTATGVGGANLTPVMLSYSGTGRTSYGPTATAPKSAGTYTVTASYAEDANYLAASSTPAAPTRAAPLNVKRTTRLGCMARRIQRSRPPLQDS